MAAPNEETLGFLIARCGGINPPAPAALSWGQVGGNEELKLILLTDGCDS